MSLSRRQVLGSAAKLAALVTLVKSNLLPAAADTSGLCEKPEAFNDDTVKQIAKDLASKPFQEEKIAMPPGFDNLNYDQYRSIRFLPEHALWRGEKLPFEAQFFHRGFFYKNRVDLYEVTNGRAVPIRWPA